MSMPFSRNVVIPLWFALFALAAFVLPPATGAGSLFLLVLGLTVPGMIYVVWQDPPRQPAVTGSPRTASPRTS